MAIYRMDNRSRFRDKYLNDVIDQVQQLNKARFSLYGQGSSGGIALGGGVGYSMVYEFSDTLFFCPPIAINYFGVEYQNYWLARGAIPTWGHTYDDTQAAQAKAEAIAANAAAGAYDQVLEDNGFGGYDLTGVTAGDYLTSGGYQEDPEVTNHCIHHPAGDKTHNGGGAKAGDGGTAAVFPEDPGAIPPGPNHITIGYSSASFKVTGQGAGFGYTLQSLPPNAVVTKALIPVKLSDFLSWTQDDTENPTFRPDAPYYNGAFWESSWISNSESVYSSNPSGSVGFMLMGRRRVGTFVNMEGRVRRQTAWDAIGGTLGGQAVSSDSWVVVDVTDICNQFLTNWKKDHFYFDFALFPSIGPSPGGSAKGWLAGLPQRPAFEILENPLWDLGAGEPLAKNHGYKHFAALGTRPDSANNPQVPYQDYGPFNRERHSEGIQWGGLVQGEGVIEWQLPATDNRRVVTYRNIVRGDSPIVV